MVVLWNLKSRFRNGLTSNFDVLTSMFDDINDFNERLWGVLGFTDSVKGSTDNVALENIVSSLIDSPQSPTYRQQNWHTDWTWTTSNLITRTLNQTVSRISRNSWISGNSISRNSSAKSSTVSYADYLIGRNILNHWFRMVHYDNDLDMYLIAIWDEIFFVQIKFPYFHAKNAILNEISWTNTVWENTCGMHRLLGATVARLTPDQKVACSNHVGVTSFV